MVYYNRIAEINKTTTEEQYRSFREFMNKEQLKKLEADLRSSEYATSLLRLILSKFADSSDNQYSQHVKPKQETT